jgi:hypothetical protein
VLRSLPRLSLIVIGVASLLLCLATNQTHEESTPMLAIRTGDVLLFEGCSFRSELVRLLQLNRSRFSHVGIASVEHSEIYVIHAHPTQGCIKERLNTLLEAHHATAVVAYRPAVTTALRANAARMAQTYVDAQVMFDSKFDSLDDTRLYCSELVFRAYHDVGVELCVLQDSVVYPDEFIEMSLLHRVSNKQIPNKSVVATADSAASSLRSRR